MKVQYDFSMAELKALIELIQELAKRSGLDECVTRAMFKRLNEKHFH